MDWAWARARRRRRRDPGTPGRATQPGGASPTLAPLPRSASFLRSARPRASAGRDANPGKPRAVQFGGSGPAARALVARRGRAEEALWGAWGSPAGGGDREGARDNELGGCALRLNGPTCEHGPNARARCPAALRSERPDRGALRPGRRGRSFIN